jgi:hypothetical protein
VTHGEFFCSGTGSSPGLKEAMLFSPFLLCSSAPIFALHRGNIVETGQGRALKSKAILDARKFGI